MCYYAGLPPQAEMAIPHDSQYFNPLIQTKSFYKSTTLLLERTHIHEKNNHAPLIL